MPWQYPSGTQYVYSYIESRGGHYDSLMFFGLQAFIKEYLLKPITKNEIDLAEKIIIAHGEPFDRETWDYVLNVHKGFIPVKIFAPQEGQIIPTKNVLVSIENTDPRCFSLTTFIETALLRAIWYPTTVASISWHIKQHIKECLEKTGDASLLQFKLHDFGSRGCSSYESSALGGMGHLLNFRGTDTVSALFAAREFYNADIAGFSIPASEHSTITSWGKDNEVKAFDNMLQLYAKPGKILACVSDSYDIGKACSELWGETLKQKIIESNATLVIRPDSGIPHEIVLECLERLGKTFGYSINDKGFKVLNNVRVIQGDGINHKSIIKITEVFINAGWSMDNVSFGMGGALLGAPQRDDQKWAMKCSAININNTWIDVFKDPRDDKGKISKRGKQFLCKNDNGYYTKSEQYMTTTDFEVNQLQLRYENGLLHNEVFWDQIIN